jgi:hypothetical protein
MVAALSVATCFQYIAAYELVGRVVCSPGGRLSVWIQLDPLCRIGRSQAQ